MANEKRARANSVGGLIEDNPLSAAATTLTSAGLAAFPVIDTTNHGAVVLDPDGLSGAPEIAYVTVHAAAATTATIVRGQEGTIAREHLRDVPWIHAPTTMDFVSPGAKVLRSAAYTMPTGGVATAVPWDAEDYDYEGYHDNATNNTRLTVPTPGVYLVGFAVQNDGQNVGRLLLLIHKNGVLVPGGRIEVNGGSNEYPSGCVVVPSLCTAAGDYFEAMTLITGTAVGMGTAGSAFWIVRLSR